MLRRVLPAALLVALLPLPSSAWDKNGHRIVAEVAARHLDPAVKVEVDRLLGGKSLAQISTWADEIRSDPRWDCAKPFHFATVEPGRTYLDRGLPEDDPGDAVRAVFHYAGILAEPGGEPAERARALRLLVHFVGDLHQPLHVQLGCDLGGNRVAVNWFGESSNLHTVWDKQLIEARRLGFTEFSDFIDSADERQLGRYRQDNPLEWVVDSQKGLERIYRCYTGRAGDNCPCFCGGCEDGSSSFGGCREVPCTLSITGDVELGYAYADHTAELLDTQLLKGGLRLADLLNWLLRETPEPPRGYREAAAWLAGIDGWAAPFEACPSSP